ncbi:hypothetical protein ACX6XY_06950 [Streptomyces sp. O3]
MRARSLAVTLAAAGAAVLAGAVPAQAHSTSYDYYAGCGFAAAQRCGHAYVSSDHKSITVCDDLADGNVAVVEYYRGSKFYRMSDGNGAKSGCGNAYSRDYPITKWRMCVDYGSYNVCIEDWIKA